MVGGSDAALGDSCFELQVHSRGVFKVDSNALPIGNAAMYVFWPQPTLRSTRSSVLRAH